eukprot:TRINITY_DN27675_c1_g1_i1.p1 TRINITY_DN27675_c1_g1~~TRINITY_DN27675_c1_g1_i1.p1  ORF type:complete len:792 (+),score=113.26 TRINITY_DN27675_c1_g1_i1:99-2474(+)
MSTNAADAACADGGKGLIFPLFPGEEDWPTPVKAIFYCAIMVYSFLGVSIIADMFVQAIEVITARKKLVIHPNGKVAVQAVWNVTVANLSLMALGSSAPEICLSVVEVVNKGMKVGALGPSTIVGSAAFNLFVIVAVCLTTIPNGESRAISELPAFFITAFFSLFAYGWLSFIISVNTPEIVDIWEAVFTLLLLPALIGVSYKVDVTDIDRFWGLRRLVYWTDYTYSPQSHEEVKQKSSTTSIVGFAQKAAVIAASAKEPQTLEVHVMCEANQVKRSRLTYSTEAITAVPGYDYAETDGKLNFARGQTYQTLQVEILPRPCYAPPCTFSIVLEDPEGCKFEDEEGELQEREVFIVTVNPPDTQDVLGTYSSILRVFHSVFNVNSLCYAFDSWKERLVSLHYCNGSWDAQSEASMSDWIFHLLGLPWNILFSVVPAPEMFGGWLCFVVCLLWILAITAVLADVAELFGCALGVPAIITALSFVALGTSMPDLFASVSAAKEDPTADASIVNVTGSNSVNVFLGLGLPWTVASLYWKIGGRTAEWEAMYPEVAESMDGAALVVPAKNLGFSVLAFTCCACLCLTVLVCRRKFMGCELGGPRATKIGSCMYLLMLWVVYVVVASWRVLRCKSHEGHFCAAPSIEQGVVMLGASTLCLGFGAVLVAAIVKTPMESPMDSTITFDGAGEDYEKKDVESMEGVLDLNIGVDVVGSPIKEEDEEDFEGQWQAEDPPGGQETVEDGWCPQTVEVATTDVEIDIEAVFFVEVDEDPVETPIVATTRALVLRGGASVDTAV